MDVHRGPVGPRTEGGACGRDRPRRTVSLRRSRPGRVSHRIEACRHLPDNGLSGFRPERHRKGTGKASERRSEGVRKAPWPGPGAPGTAPPGGEGPDAPGAAAAPAGPRLPVLSRSDSRSAPTPACPCSPAPPRPDSCSAPARPLSARACPCSPAPPRPLPARALPLPSAPASGPPRPHQALSCLPGPPAPCSGAGPRGRDRGTAGFGPPARRRVSARLSAGPPVRARQ